MKERRHDSNFESVSKGLQPTPPAQLALPAADAEQKGTKAPKGPKKSGSGALQKPAAPGQVEPGTASKHKSPCALHAAGHCCFGEKCRNHRTGEPGSDAARKAYADFQKAKGQGGDKPNKGKGKGKNDGKSKGKNDSKQPKGAAATAITPATVAATASTVTIMEVDGQKVMGAWEGFLLKGVAINVNFLEVECSNLGNIDIFHCGFTEFLNACRQQQPFIHA